MRQIIVGISAVFLAAFLDLTDNTSVSVAFPSIASSLGASHAVLQWVSIGNTLALGAAALLVPGLFLLRRGKTQAKG